MILYSSPGNITNTTLDEDPRQLERSSVYITFVTILVVVCVISICANLAITFTILCNSKNLRTVPNILIANWAIADLVPLITAPIEYGGYAFLKHDSTGIFVIDGFAELEMIFFNTIISFASALVIDWFLASYFSKSSHQFRKYYKYTVASVWGFTLILICFSIGFSGTYGPFIIVPFMLFYFSYPILTVLVMIMHFVRICKRGSANNSALALVLATVFVVCWFELWVTHNYVAFDNLYFSFLEIINVIPGIIIFILLCFKDQDFRTHLCIKWKRIRDVSIKAYS